MAVQRGYYIPVMNYHRVASGEWYYNTTEQFQKHCEYLKNYGYTTILPETFYKYFKGLLPEDQMPDKPVMLTCDDGIRTFYENAYPVLLANDQKFTFFLITSEIDTYHVPQDRDKDFCQWDEIKNILATGTATLGWHTHEGHRWTIANENGDNCGVLAQPNYTPYGCNPVAELGQFHWKKYWIMPIAGTTEDIYTGQRYAIDTTMSFRSSKNMTVSTLWVRAAVPVPADKYYDCFVDIYINGTLVKANWQVPFMPDWLSEVNTNITGTWLTGMWAKIVLDTTASATSGSTVEVRFVTKNTHTERAEWRGYMEIRPGESGFSVVTNSWGGDYQVSDTGYVSYPAIPWIILGNETGTTESDAVFRSRVADDWNKFKTKVETYAGNCIDSFTAINSEGTGVDFIADPPLCGMRKYVESVDVETDAEGNVIGYIYNWYTSEIKTEYDIVVSSSGTYKGLKLYADPSRMASGDGYSCLIDIYIDNTKVVTMAQPPWLKEEMYFEFDQETYISSGNHVLKIQTLNRDGIWEDGKWYWDHQGVILAGCTEYDYDYVYDPETGEQIGDDTTYRTFAYDDQNRLITKWPHALNVEFYGENNSYPTGKYVPPGGLWFAAYPFGQYSQPLIDELTAQGVAQMFTVEANRFDPRPIANPACVNQYTETPRISMYNDNFLLQNNPEIGPDQVFAKLLRTFTMEEFRGSNNFPSLGVVGGYELYLGTDTTSSDLLGQIDRLDIVIFDSYNFDTAGTLSGTYALSAMNLVKNHNRLAIPMIGNFDPVLPGFNPDVTRAVFNNPTSTINQIVNLLNTENLPGVAIDFEECYPEDKTIATAWFTQLAQALHIAGNYKLLIVAAPYPINNSPQGSDWDAWFDYAAIGGVSDYISPMTYLDHGPWSDPGPIMSYQQFKSNYEYLVKIIPSYKLLAGLNLFGSTWPSSGKGDPAEKNPIEITNWGFEYLLLPIFETTDGEIKMYHVNAGTSYFPTPKWLAAKMQLVKDLKMAGILFWKLGDADDNYFKPWTSFDWKKNRR